MIRHVLMLSVLMLAMFTVSGCDSKAIVEAREDLAEAKITLDQAVKTKADIDAAVDAAVAVLPPNVRLPQIVIDASKKIDTAIGTARDAVGKLEERVAKADSSLDLAEGVLNTATPFLPPPYGTLAAAAGGLIIGLIRARQNRKTARKVVRSFEAAKAAGRLEIDTSAAAVLNATQGSDGKRLVDEAQGKVTAMPF